ncbi:unnamed protein product [Brassica rapa]|uniref:Uncharacterized protein n=2 Tax=Brassica TaxID=3705 RepID=A0A3P5ZPK1_BRACM|nr:unnamed protein product [Brassica napus]CAG7880608.1 unnamed protein product [Brassica rapa]VDC79999.1 unnamed protein product [Brassica rapa]
MRRSASASIVSDQLSAKAPSPSPSPPRIQSDTDSEDVQLLLPRYDPNSYPGKKDKTRLRSAENAIHFIPLILIICALILCSSNDQTVNMVVERVFDHLMGKPSTILHLYYFFFLKIFLLVPFF